MTCIREIARVREENPTYGGDRVSGMLPHNVNVSRTALFDVLRKLNLGMSPEEILGYARCAKGRPKTARTDENAGAARDLVARDNQTASCSVRNMAGRLNVSKSSAHRIVKRDLKMRCFKKVKTTKNAEKTRYAPIATPSPPRRHQRNGLFGQNQ